MSDELVACVRREGITLVPDSEADKPVPGNVSARRAGPTDLPARTDLPKGHPLYGKRVLAVVPSGCPDCTVDARGRMVPVGMDGLPLPTTPLPVDLEEERPR
jgi:hypothetical protein